MTCKDCNISKKAKFSKEPAACAWYIDNVICGNKSTKDCPYYKIEILGGMMYNAETGEKLMEFKPGEIIF